MTSIYSSTSFETELVTHFTLHKKCPYSELFWPVFFQFRTEYGQIRSISLYLVPILENTDQNNSKYGNFLRSASVFAVVVARCRMQYGRYFPSFSHFATYQKNNRKDEKQGKYLPILHEATCDNNFIVKCLLKSNVARITDSLTNWIELA